jgi:hypothetical protein
VAFVAVDQRFVEHLEHVALDLAEPEAAHVDHDAPDEVLAVRIGDDPVEEVAFDGAADACRLEGASR